MTMRTIALPAFNESGFIGQMVENTVKAAEERSDPFEIIVVDNASTDATAEIVRKISQRDPRVRLISHPENRLEVCQRSDYVGSTEFILNTVRDKARPGQHWLVGTELNLVNRLAEEMKPRGVTVQFMSPMVCMSTAA